MPWLQHLSTAIRWRIIRASHRWCARQGALQNKVCWQGRKARGPWTQAARRQRAVAASAVGAAEQLVQAGGALHNAVAQLTPALVVQCAGDLDVALAALYVRATAQDARQMHCSRAARCGEAAHAHSDVRRRGICAACGCASGRRGRPGAGRGGRQRGQRRRAPLSILLTRPASLSGSSAQQCACYAYTVCHECAHPSFRGAKSARQSPQGVSRSGFHRVRDRIAPLTSQVNRPRHTLEQHAVARGKLGPGPARGAH